MNADVGRERHHQPAHDRRLVLPLDEDLVAKNPPRRRWSSCYCYAGFLLVCLSCILLRIDFAAAFLIAPPPVAPSLSPRRSTISHGRFESGFLTTTTTSTTSPTPRSMTTKSGESLEDYGAPERGSKQSNTSTGGGGISVGIDLGTTYSAVAVLKGGIPSIVPVPHSGRTMPSVVTFLVDQTSEGDGQDNDYSTVLVGRPACEQEVATGGAYRNVKRILGTGGKLSSDIAAVVPFLHASNKGKTFKKDSLLNQLQDAAEHPTLLKNKQRNNHNNNSEEKDPFLRPEVISSHVLQALKAAAEAHTGQRVVRAVIGVPAYFHDAQRQATKLAAELAGIGQVKLLREPEAAALAYGIGKEQIGLGDEDELVLVFDLGGGTFDVSMLAVGGGITEIISTSGNAQLGGSVFDARIAQHCRRVLSSSQSGHLEGSRSNSGSTNQKWSDEAKQAVVRSAEAIRIYLSNNRKINLALPVAEEAWSRMNDAADVILPINYVDKEEGKPLVEDAVVSNSTHLLFSMTRKEMERLCKDEFQALLRPVREVAIMSGALLPGDSSPSIVEAALELDELEQKRTAVEFDDFYADDEDNNGNSDDNEKESDPDFLLEIDMKLSKKVQQRGRQKARSVAKQERKFRQEKRKLETSTTSTKNARGGGVPESTSSGGNKDKNVKVRDGITGRPISRVVLVGGATRMPGVGRLLAALTGVVPQKTVNPDEAVALGCAVHAGILDGEQGMGTVLNPMQSAILRAVAMQQGLGGGVEEDEDAGDEEDFDSVEYF